jgi:predicted nuclease of predicted toxin-antitoxin system
MSQKFHKHKLLLDENMPPRRYFPRLNHLFDVKHIAVDLKQGGISDEAVYKEAARTQRLIVTFNGDDFKHLAGTSTQTGVLAVSDNLPNEHIDKKLVALLLRSTPNALFGKFTSVTGET